MTASTPQATERAHADATRACGSAGRPRPIAGIATLLPALRPHRCQRNPAPPKSTRIWGPASSSKRRNTSPRARPTGSTNNLPRPSTIHWHGLRVPIDMDGVPGYSQDPVQPGETFTYDFVVPDAGIYRYHPHVMSAAQVGFGLYGAFPAEDPTETVGIADDLVLVLSDIGVTEDGDLLPADTGGTVGMRFGREGNQVLVNGRRLPPEEFRNLAEH